jgi:site-specific DNA-methyltransferase (adenine-specific)
MRDVDFQNIGNTIQNTIVARSAHALLAEGDSLAIIRQMPSQSVSLILTDPPYHTTKKSNIVGDTAFGSDGEYLAWLAEYIEEWKRVLRPNGSIFCFCASDIAARIEVQFYQQFNVLAQVVWTKPNDPGFDGWKQKMKKEALRQWYPHSERIIFAEPAYEGNLFRSYLGNLLREKRHQAGLTMHQLAAMTGAHGAVNHGGAISNWEAGRNIPSREQYAKLCEALLSTGKVDLMPPFEDVVRRFNIDASKEFTDVWTFSSVRPYKGKHPAEKPLDMLEHAIEATTWPGDIVLDCFAGSGNTALAALRLGRRAVAIELAPQWVRQIAIKLNRFVPNEQLASNSNGHSRESVDLERDDKLPLFARS